MQIGTGLPGQDVFALCTLEVQEVSTEGMYRPQHEFLLVASPCQTLRELLVEDNE